jgi:hypothetical protein
MCRNFKVSGVGTSIFRTCCSLLVANHYRRPSDFAIHILLLVSPERSSSCRIPVAIHPGRASDGKFLGTVPVKKAEKVFFNFDNVIIVPTMRK